MGTWIEMPEPDMGCGAEIVVPLVGTWIEILPVTASLNIIESFPSWERGLKSQTKQSQTGIAVSFPSWERGLKYKRSCRKLDRYMSFPSWERGLKLDRKSYE